MELITFLKIKTKNKNCFIFEKRYTIEKKGKKKLQGRVRQSCPLGLNGANSAYSPRLNLPNSL